ncbi:hypothetical protein MMC29_007429 [Sticta canariensis]|nr:hypothetical protein [Sticta canariensis]
MLFDFASYLLRLDPSQSYTVTQLTGGVVNITVRAIKSPATHANAGRFPDHRTIILKSVLALTMAFVITTDHLRWSVEALALSFWTPPDGPLEPILRELSVLVPHLLYHDQDSHVLILSDLGDLLTLREHISGQTILSGDVAFYQSVSVRLGSFFAVLHSNHSLQVVGNKRMDELQNPDVKGFIYNEVVVPVEACLKRFNIPDASQLYRRVESDFPRENRMEEQSLVVGDLWPGGILLSKVDAPEDVLGVVDWEFASLERGLNGDMAQLFAHLRLHLLASTEGSLAQTALETLLASISSTYRHQCRILGSAWTLPGSPRFVDSPCAASVFTLRSAFILHDREIINNALLQKWPCKCCEDSQYQNCALLTEMVNKGAWYLRRAGDNDVEFVGEENWREIYAENENILRGLL